MDILDLVYLVVPCAACGGPYEVSARVARSSDTMLHEGCPVQNPRNCPELHYASLVDPKALDELCAVWARVEAAARAGGCEAVLHAGGSGQEASAADATGKGGSGRAERPNG